MMDRKQTKQSYWSTLPTYLPVSYIGYLRDALFTRVQRLALVLSGLGEIGQTLLGSFRLTRTAAGR
jgi:hypothetical protein